METVQYLNRDKSKLTIEDIREIHEILTNKNKETKNKKYLHDLLEKSEIILPENPTMVRNPEVERRCQLLLKEQLNEEYRRITSDVSCCQYIKSETLAYQMKEMNQYIWGTIQVFVSSVAGFCFGFFGIGIMVETTDSGKLLMGLLCSFITFIADMYFLIRKIK